MKETKAELLLHPVRMKIIQSLLGGHKLTAADMLKLQKDIPQATLYRHLNKLVEANLIHIHEQKQVRGAVEKIYSLTSENMVLSQADLAHVSKEDHMKYFTTFLFGLMDDFSAYLKQDVIDLEKDGVGYRQIGLYLSDEEFRDFAVEISSVFRKFIGNQPNEKRVKRIFSTIVIPEDKKEEE
ncbi:helix-turn-helix domain-containing protein [Brevibacillus ginsengisoli]|uniref:helix-turn-helix domain-containing protein n=1 Tax=Brevibacillus ginsengisoli TaxID=363854 RepID=UPI003CE75291